MFGEEPAKAAPIIILMIINIHHYFTDGVIWKLSNPEVRQELFAHLESARPAPAVVAPPADRTPVGSSVSRKASQARR
jgi:hypothetical protein